jgi:hypothetical protein
MARQVPLIFGVFFFALGGGRVLGQAPQNLLLMREVVDVHFSEQPGFQAIDLIRRRDAEEIVVDLISVGLLANRPQELIERIPADDSFLHQQFAGQNGQRFMRKVGAVPGGYAELEKLGTGPQGRGAARTVQAAKGGHELIEYLATTPHGKQLARQMSRVTGAKSRRNAVYTKQDLLAALAE